MWLSYFLMANFQRPTFFATAATCFGTISFGYAIGYSSPSTYQLKKSGHLTESTAAVFGSLLSLSLLIGTSIAGSLMDRKGRRWTAIFASFPFLVGWLLIYFYSKNNSQLFIGRILTGIGSGITLTSVPNYISEIASQSNRGALCSSVQLAITVGICLAYLLGTMHTWSAMAAVGVTLAIVNVLCLMAVYESPRWLVVQGRIREAREALAYLRNTSNIDDEITTIQESLDMESNQIDLRSICHRNLRSQFIISVVVLVLQQTTGINAVMYYTQEIFDSAGFKDYSAYAALIIGFVQVITTAVACCLMDKAGRRKLLLFAGLIMSIMCFLFSGFYHLDSAIQESYKMLAVICLVIYIVGFSIGWGPVPVILMSELFPNNARALASAISLGMNTITSFIITFAFLLIVSSMGTSFVFAIFGTFCLLGAFYVYKYVPETKGKSLEEIQMLFTNKDKQFYANF